MRGLPVDWTKNLPEPERKAFEEAVRSSGYVLTRLLQILDEKISTVERFEENPDSYGPGYEDRQKFENGRRRGFKEIRALLTFLED